jgi:hypothetical protein
MRHLVHLSKELSALLKTGPENILFFVVRSGVVTLTVVFFVKTKPVNATDLHVLIFPATSS